MKEKISKFLNNKISEKTIEKTMTIAFYSLVIIACGLFVYCFSDAMIANPDAGNFEINGVIIHSDLITDANDDCYTYITMLNGSTYLMYDWHTLKLYTPITLTLKESYFTSDCYFLKNWEVIE